MKPHTLSMRAFRASRAGFNLIEVLVAIAIFGIGFSMIAGVVPAGHLMSAKTQDDVVSIIAARNAVALIEAKKIAVPGMEHLYMHDLLSEGAYRNSANQGMVRALNGSFGGGDTSTPSSSSIRDKYPNDDDLRIDYEDCVVSYSANTANGWPANQSANPAAYCRGFWGASAAFRAAFDTNDDGYGGNGGNSYKYDDATDLTWGRIHMCHNRMPTRMVIPDVQVSYPSFIADTSRRDVYLNILTVDLNANALNRNWVAYAVALRRREGQSWTERLANPAQPDLVQGGSSSTSWFRVCPQGLNSPAGTTDGGGNGHPNAGWPIAWGYWNSYCVQGETNDKGIPGLFNLAMIVYDWKSNLIQVSYPNCYVPGGICGPVDRRLAPGERFIARESGVVFTVLSTRDSGPNKAYQIVEVFPPLATTLLGPNSGGVNCDPNWRLREGFFAPRPVEGGPSPLVRVEIIPAARGFTYNANH